MSHKHIAEQINEYPTTSRDLAWLFIGHYIGAGVARTVYKHALDPSLVIKYEHGNETFQNILEWEIWNTIKDTKLAKWFAPCVAISPNGHFLIQKKAEMLHKDQFPSHVPALFTDLKYQNFGRIGKQFVCFDYGSAHIHAINKALKLVKLKKTDWWSIDDDEALKK